MGIKQSERAIKQLHVCCGMTSLIGLIPKVLSYYGTQCVGGGGLLWYLEKALCQPLSTYGAATYAFVIQDKTPQWSTLGSLVWEKLPAVLWPLVTVFIPLFVHLSGESYHYLESTISQLISITTKTWAQFLVNQPLSLVSTRVVNIFYWNKLTRVLI